MDEDSGSVGESLVAEMELPATGREGFFSSKTGEDWPFILRLFFFSAFALDCKPGVFRSPHSLELAFPNSLDAAAGLSTVAAPNPTRARNYRARRAEPSRAGLRGVDVSFSLARLLAPCLCPEAKTALTVACLAPCFSPQKPPVSLSSGLHQSA